MSATINKPANTIGLIMRTTDNRIGRERLDIALALLAMDLPVRIFVETEAMPALQLIDNATATELAWHRLWPAIAELGGEVYCRRQTMTTGMQLAVTVTAVADAELARLKCGCAHLIGI